MASADNGYVQPTVDVPALQRLLDGEHAAVRGQVRASLVEHAGLLESAERLAPDAFRDEVLEAVVTLAGTGQTAYHFPTEYGGAGDFGATVAAFETTAFGDLSALVKIGVQFGLFGGAVLNLGTKPHHDAWLADIAAGRLLGCFAMTETGHGSNVQAIRTTATYDASTREFVIRTPDDAARKDYIGNAARHGRMAAVFAQLVVDGDSKGVHCLMVPIRDEAGQPMPGVRIGDCGHKMGLNGVDNGRLWFDPEGTVRVPRENLLNRFADVDEDGTYSSEIESPNRRFFTMLGTLVMGRVSVAGAGVSASKVALAVATRYADRRRQFGEEGQPETVLLDYGQHQRRLLPRLARTYALHFSQDMLRTIFDDVFSGRATGEEIRRELESRAAGIKALATWHATDTIQECREACGGAGYLSANRFAALKADTDVFTTFEGDNTVLLQLVAKGLLTSYASEFSDMNQFDMVKFVAGMAVEQVIESTMAHKLLERLKDLLPGGDEGDQEAGLLDPAYHLQMFRFREEHLVKGIAKRLKRGTDAGMPAAEVFSRVQDHVIVLGHAHVERLMLESFIGQFAAMPQGPNRIALGLLCDLFALSTIEANRGWFLEHQRLTGNRAKAISREVNDLCRKLRPLAVDLVDAFGIPEQMLRAEELLAWA